MRKRLTLLLLPLLIALFSISFGHQVNAAAVTATQDEVCAGIGLAEGQSTCASSNNGSSVGGLIKTVISVLSYIIGVAAVIMVVIGGIKYMTSGGDSGAIGSAKKTITYALIGLVIAALAQVMVRFVFKSTVAPQKSTVETEFCQGGVCRR